MQWRGRAQSTNVEDRRGMSGKGLAVGGGLGGIVLLVLYLLMGGNPGDMAICRRNSLLTNLRRS
jgi:uncharacterized protein